MHVAFEIVRPWPRVHRTHLETYARRRATGARFLQIGCRQFWNIGRWELYFEPAITVWANTGANGRRWRVRFPILRDLRRKVLTRCEWCGGRSRKGDYVNVHGNVEYSSKRWWRGERGLYHGDCSSIAHAKTVCLCGDEGGPWEHDLGGYAYGRCAACAKYRGWLSPDERTSPTYPGLHTNRLMAAIPDGQRDPAVMAVVREMWAFHREGRLI